MAAFAAPAPVRRSRASLHSKCTRASTRGDTPPPPSTPVAVSRRAALATAAAAALFQLAQVPPTRAATEDVTSTQFGYSFSMPSTGWTRSSADLSGMRTLTAFTRDADKTGATNVSMVETPLPGDFMKLTSFGPMESVLVRFFQLRVFSFRQLFAVSNKSCLVVFRNCSCRMDKRASPAT